jgi:hypothetical protein
VRTEDVALRAPAAQGDGHREDELLDGFVDHIGTIMEYGLDAGIERLDTRHAVLHDSRPDRLRELVVRKQHVHELGELGLERCDSGEPAVAGVEREPGLLGELSVNDLVEGEMLLFGAELAVEPGGGDDGLEVLGVIMGVTGGDQVPR